MRPLERCSVVLVSAPSAVKQVAARTIVSVFRARSSRRVPARPVSLPAPAGAVPGPPGPGAAGLDAVVFPGCGCGRDCGGGAWVTGPLPLAGDGVSEPDDRKVEGVPSNRGISPGVTTSRSRLGPLSNHQTRRGRSKRRLALDITCATPLPAALDDRRTTGQ